MRMTLRTAAPAAVTLLMGAGGKQAGVAAPGAACRANVEATAPVNEGLPNRSWTRFMTGR